MSDFKVGDRVRIVTFSEKQYNGHVGTVVGLPKVDMWYEVVPDDLSILAGNLYAIESALFYAEELELIES